MHQAEQILKKYFGYDSFREGQETLVNGILSGRDVLGIMPTGAGKSLCYQIPALLLPGMTLVVSPLISLMQDQVFSLNQAGVRAAYLNSSLTPGQYRTALKYMRQNQYKIVYVAPERLLTEPFLDAVRDMDISLLSVDEAHCISQWGQDFRPSYLKIPDFVHTLKKRPVLAAFTATATREVREDILALLDQQNPITLVTGFDRENLKFTVRRPADKWQAAQEVIRGHEQECGIIYCLTRKLVEEVCERLVREGYPATRYHAGLSDDERHHNQEDFLYDRKQIMVATNVFGMGIDKSNVRYVIHYNMPKNIESYYQEAGRAGRDGLPSDCVLLYAGQDVATNNFFIDKMEAPEDADEETAKVIRERERERLKKMTWYCLTNDCLRDYILRYFGEYGSGYCGNCSNCLTKFREEDVSETARSLIGFVKACSRNYGLVTVTDAAHGSRSSKILKAGLDQNPHYASCSDVPLPKLRQIMNHLAAQGDLKITDDRYPVVCLTPGSDEILQGRQVVMKTAEELPKSAPGKTEPSEKAGKRGGRPADDLQGDMDRGLFERLRALRLEIAREEKVPPYIIFSDKTLVQMCLLKPKSRTEMLQVSGVGEVKYEKYGERFLAALSEEA
ncbi:MAG: DNA helicase RecQ [Lachnospiraceae bacterium]|nr:DNA helicase RecQ [Lachnospiraceae bacterium]